MRVSKTKTKPLKSFYIYNIKSIQLKYTKNGSHKRSTFVIYRNYTVFSPPPPNNKSSEIIKWHNVNIQH